MSSLPLLGLGLLVLVIIVLLAMSFSAFSDFGERGERWKSAWNDVTRAAPGELTELQRRCEITIQDAFTRRGHPLERLVRLPIQHHSEDGFDYVIQAEAPAFAAEVFVYGDRAEVITPDESFLGEKSHAESPEAYLARLRDFVETLPPGARDS